MSSWFLSGWWIRASRRKARYSIYGVKQKIQQAKQKWPWYHLQKHSPLRPGPHNSRLIVDEQRPRKSDLSIPWRPFKRSGLPYLESRFNLNTHKMTDFFKSTSPPSGMCCLVIVWIRALIHCRTDMTAKKEALMNNIRAEMTLLSVQELMNVRSVPCSCASSTHRCFRKGPKNASKSVSPSLVHPCQVPNRSVVSHVLTFHIAHMVCANKTCLDRCLDRYMDACK